MSTPEKGVFFGGGGWSSLYQVGVIDALYASHDNIRTAGGSSSGAMYAVAFLLKIPVSELFTAWKDAASQARIGGCFGKGSDYADTLLRRMLPDDGEEYLMLNGRLFIGITLFPATASLINRWTSNDDIRDCLHASMHIPLYCKYTTRCIGIDGAWVQSLWDLPGMHMTIHSYPMNQRAHVCPQPGQIPWQAGVWPVKAGHEESRMFELGRQNMSAYLQNPEKHNRSDPSMSIKEAICTGISFVCLVGAWTVFWVRRSQMKLSSFFKIH
jgi:hypothetical protein